MGIKLFSSSTYDGYTPSYSIEPNPLNFNIKEIQTINGHTIAKVNYPNCTNFEGNKILFFKNKTSEQVKAIKLLDPHFSNKDKNTPFARFEPTKEGLDAAIELAFVLKN